MEVPFEIAPLNPRACGFRGVILPLSYSVKMPRLALLSFSHDLGKL